MRHHADHDLLFVPVQPTWDSTGHNLSTFSSISFHTQNRQPPILASVVFRLRSAVVGIMITAPAPMAAEVLLMLVLVLVLVQGRIC